MVKKLLSLAVLLAFCCMANAQQLRSGGRIEGKTVKQAFKNRPQTRAYGQEVFTYDQSGGSVSYLGAGVNDYDCAIYVPTEYAGKSIEAIAIAIIDETVIDDLKVWVATELPDNVDTDCAVVESKSDPMSVITDGALDITELAEPYTIPAGGCYVGYSFSVTNTQSQYGYYPVAVDGGTDTEGSMYMRFTGSQWADYYGQDFGNLVTQVLISGNDYSENAATVDGSFNDAYAGINSEGNANVTITNRGVNPITSIGYTVTDVATGSVSDEQTVNLGGIELGYVAQLALPLAAGAETGTYEKQITITKVNGEANQSTSGVTTKGNLIVLPRIAQRKVVEEEFTASGCWYCTRGIAGMKALSDKYPDTFIGIAVHGSMNYPDPMQIESYYDSETFSNFVVGYPTAVLNRTQVVDPYFGSSSSTMLGIVDDVEALMQVPALAEVNVSPVWNDEANTVIDVNTDVTFLFDSDDAPYALAYVLVEDGLSGANDNSQYSYGWWQANAYMGAQGAESEPYLYEWVTRGENATPGGNPQLAGPYVKDVVYDHVAVMTQDIDTGVEGSITAPIVLDAVQSHSTTFDLSNGIEPYYSNYYGDLLQDKSKLKVVALLINTETGEIVNADEKEVAPYGSTVGINNSVAAGEEVKEVGRYSLDGAKISAPVKGINIIKMSDGTTRKVIVK